VFRGLALAAAAWLGGLQATPAGAVHLPGDPEQPFSRFAVAISELEDQNGDGRWEILVGAPEDDSGGTDDGRVYLWYGGRALPAGADLVMTGDLNEGFGFAVERVGDVDDDGYGDFAVGAPSYDGSGTDRGRVYLFLGGPGLSATPDVILESPSPTSHFGHAVSAAGDFDGDGIDDFIVGAPFGDIAGFDAGEAYIYYGRRSWPGTVAGADLTLRGQIGGDHFGWDVTDLGRFFGDMTDCVAVGAPFNNTHGGMDGGAVYIYRGADMLPPDDQADLELGNNNGVPAGSEFGYVVRGLGDWSGDGHPDLAVGAPFDNAAGLAAGLVEIYFGGAGPDTLADRYVRGESGEDHFGMSLADAGNVLGSSLPDLLIGAPSQSDSGDLAGRAYIYAGGSSSQASAASLHILPVAPILPESEAFDEYGTAVSAAGDFDGDGFLDYAIGAPGGNLASGIEAGYVNLVDSSGEAVPTLLLLWDAAWSQEPGLVEIRCALSAPATEVSRLSLWRRAGAGPPPGVVVYQGVPSPAMRAEAVATGVWRLVDPWPGDGGPCLYDLTVELLDGGQLQLTGLAGPPPAATGFPAELAPACPNPFNPRTSLRYRAPRGTPIAVRVLDLRGAEVKRLAAGQASGSWQEIQWDGRATRGPAAAGVYLIELQAGEQRCWQRVLLLK
jgi:hypothetical protein